MFDGRWYAEDVVTGALESSLSFADGEEESIQWDGMGTVTANTISTAHAERFNDDELYSIETTVARPIRQEYNYGDDTVTFVKPATELAQSAWGVDNAPVTIGHPEQRRVVADSQVHGFFRDPWYDRVDDSLNATMYIPVTDGAVQSAINDSRDVSVGFYSDIAATDRDDVDGEQVSILFDHVALVTEGRCSSEDGCKVQL